jgi:competence protein ComEC
VSIPAALPAAAVVVGAVLGTLFNASSIPAVLLMLSAWVLACVCAGVRLRRTFLMAVAAVFLSASWTMAIRANRQAVDPPLRASLSRALRTGPVVLEGRLREDAAPGENGVALSLQVERWTWGGETKADAGGVRLTVGGTLGLDEVGQWRAGRAIRVPALLREPGRYQDPGVPDGRLALARKGIALVGSVKSGSLVEVRARGSWAAEAGARVRDLARTAVRRHVGRYASQSAAIVIAILIGDRVGLDDEVQRRLQEAGTYHVIAISGGNIAILAGLMLWLLRVSGAGHRAGSWVTIGVLVGYAGVVGGSASVVRATVMAVIYLVARQADHRSAPVNALAVTCALILLATPDALADVAFWLTFGATLGILVGVGLAGAWLPHARWLRVPAGLLLMSLCAELALFPVAARVFARVTFAGLALNFVAIPMMSVAQVAGMLTVPASWVWPRAADACGFVAHLGAAGLVRSAALVDLVPWLSYRLPPPHWIPIAGYYGGWAIWLATKYTVAGSSHATRCRGLLRGIAMAGVMVCGAWILVEPVTWFAPGVRGRLRVTALDVGHGDAVLIQLPDRRSVLVDTGGSLTGSTFDIGGRIVAPALWALGSRRLDVLVLTHGDPDHVGGAASVVRDFRPKEIWEGVPVLNLPVMQALKQQAIAARIPWKERRAGDVVRMGDVTLRIWHPPPAEWERPRVRNDDSMVIELRYGQVSLLLTGDIGQDVERTLAAQLGPAGLRALKVPHHGSSTSSSPEFVSALKPRVAFLSAGATTKVSDDVLRRYQEVGATLYRTDIHGAITLETDGSSVTVKTFTGEHGTFMK